MSKTANLKKIVNHIVTTVTPDKVILFGSRARGDNRQDSDYDLLIIKKRLKNARRLTTGLYHTFFVKNIYAPVDLLAINCGKYNKLKNDVGYIYKTISREGKVLYER